MNTTRKIFISLLFIFTLSVISIDSTFAQTSQGTTVATVNISNAKIVSNEGRNYKISFDISNRVGAQPQIKYSVRLTKVLSNGEIVADEKVYEETISLGENAKVNKVIDYSIPDPLSIGTYKMWIDSKNSSGLQLGIAYIGEVKLTKNIPNTVEIVPESCHVTISGRTEKLPISTGIYTQLTDTLLMECEIQNNLSEYVLFTPNFITRNHTVFGDMVDVSDVSFGSSTINVGKNIMNFVIPKAGSSQNYHLSLSLTSEDKKITSNTISFNYTIAGQTGTIKNVVFDKTYYKAGDNANLQIFSTQTSTSTIALLIMGDDGVCSRTLNKDISNFSIINLKIPIIKNCNNPKVNITLSANGNVLDSKNFDIITPININTAMFAPKILIIFTVLFFVIVGIFIYRRKHSFMMLTVISIIFITSFYFFGTNKVEASNLCYLTCASGCTQEITQMVYPFYGTCLHCYCPPPPSPPPSQPPAPTIGYFIVSKNPTTYNSSVDISWSSSNTTYCTLGVSGGGVNNGTFTVGTSGSRPSGNLTSNTTLTLSCTSSSGVNTPNSTIIVTVNPPANVEINAATTTVSNGGATNISWSSTGVDYCDITKNSSPWMTSSSNYQYLSQFGSSGSGAGQFDGPFGVGVDSQGYIYVTDTNNNRIQKFNPSGQFVWWFGYNGTATGTHTTGTGISGSLEGQFDAPTGLDVDSSDDIYVADSGNNRIQKFDKNGNLKYVKVGWPTYSFGSYGTTGQAEFNIPSGIAVGSSYIYVADTYNNRILAISRLNGYDNYIFGNQSNTPFGITIDSSEKIYVADSGNNRIQKLDSYTSNTPSLQIGTSFPKGITLDSKGNIYFTDNTYSNIYKYDSSGNYQAWLYSYQANGGKNPTGITLDSSNYMYVVDSGNDRIQKFSPPNNNLSGSQSSGSLTSDTTFNATCVKDDGVTYQSVTKSVTVNINEEVVPPPTNVSATSNACGKITVSWTSPESTFKIYRDGAVIKSDAVGSSFEDILSPGDTSQHRYYVIASNQTLGDSASSTAHIASAAVCPQPPPTISNATCTFAQAEPFDGNIYVNRNTTLRVMLDTTNLAPGFGTKWSGTNLSTGIIPGLTYNKIYTTIGLKNISAEVTGTLLSGETFSTTCSTSTVVKLDPGTGGEI